MENNEIFTANLQGTGAQADAENIADGERIPMAPKELGSTEVYPQSIKHNSNGRFIVVCDNSEYIILQPRRPWDPRSTSAGAPPLRLTPSEREHRTHQGVQELEGVQVDQGSVLGGGHLRGATASP